VVFVSKRTPAERFWKHVAVIDDDVSCWLWTGATDTAGYGRFRLAHERRGVVRASRFSWEITYGHPGDLHVLHKCDTPLCVRPDHLFLGTQRDNMRDAVAKGRHRHACFHGEDHPGCKLTDADVREIRKLRADGLIYREIAQRFGVGISQVARICNGTSRSEAAA